MIYDLHLDGTPAGPRIAGLLGALFEVRPEHVRLLRDYEELAAHAQTNVLCIARSRAGDFPLSLEIIVSGPASLTEEEVAAGFAREFQCACMTTTDPVNPYLWTLVTREGNLLQADVDEEALDRQELRVVRIVRPEGTA